MTVTTHQGPASRLFPLYLHVILIAILVRSKTQAGFLVVLVHGSFDQLDFILIYEWVGRTYQIMHVLSRAPIKILYVKRENTQITEIIFLYEVRHDTAWPSRCGIQKTVFPRRTVRMDHDITFVQTAQLPNILWITRAPGTYTVG